MKSLLFIFVLFVGLLSLQATEDIEYIDQASFQQVSSLDSSQNLDLNQDGLSLLSNKAQGSLTSSAVSTRIAFNAMTVSWIAEIPSEASFLVELQGQSDLGEWGEWQKVEKDNDIHFSTKNLSYRYRVNLQANSKGLSPKVEKLTFHYNFIYPKMLESVPVFLAQETRAIGKPKVVSRSQWGARPAKKGYSTHRPNRITIHHTWRPTATNFRGASTVRSIQNYHMDSNGWSDIGYHFLIGTYPSSGETIIYQGRPETVIGAHTGGANTNNVGVNIIGDYTTERLHANSYKNLIHVLAWLCDRYSISPNQIYGHKDFSATACPGQNIYSKLNQIKKDVREYRGE